MQINPLTRVSAKELSTKMNHAIRMAEIAAAAGEVPVGAAVFCRDKLIATGYNMCETKNNPTMHAELIAIGNACEVLDSKYLSECELYVTLEPCFQCAGALLNAHVGLVVFGAYDIDYGSCVSRANINNIPSSWSLPVLGGINEQQCKSLLDTFFKTLRNQLNNR